MQTILITFLFLNSISCLATLANNCPQALWPDTYSSYSAISVRTSSLNDSKQYYSSPPFITK